MSQLEKEIEATHFILNRLKQNFVLYHREKMYEKIKVTAKDIKTVELELQRLLGEQQQAIEIEKEPASNVGGNERSGTTISQ